MHRIAALITQLAGKTKPVTVNALLRLKVELLLFVFTVLNAAAFTEPLLNLSLLPCAKSGYCSLGQVRPFIGDVANVSSLRSCLEARSYRKEAILIAETRLVTALTTVHNARSVGYAHSIVSRQVSAASWTVTWCSVMGGEAPGLRCQGRKLPLLMMPVSGSGSMSVSVSACLSGVSPANP